MDSITSWQSSVPLSTILGLLLFLYTISWISRSRRNNRATASNAPPVPKAGGAWPVIGHLHLLGRREPPHATLARMADKYGPIFAVRLGVHPNLIVSSWEIAKECFTVNDRALASRPKFIAFEVMGYNFGLITFSPYGPYWRHVRKMATVHLLSNHRIDTLKHVVGSKVKTAMKDTYDCWLELNKSGSKKEEPVPIEMKEWFGDISLNVILRMVVGKWFAKDEENERTRKALRVFFDLSGAFLISDAVPFLRWLDLGGQEKAMKKTAKELDRVAQVWLDEHKSKRDSGSGQIEAKDHDFMDVLLSIVDEAQVIDGHDSDTTIKATCLTLILAGTDTTTVTLIWALSLLMNNREVLKKAIDEVDRTVGKERMPEESDLKNLPYVQAILKETLRLYPAAPLSASHECIEDCTVGGFHVPSGMRLMTNLSKLHRDPKVYPEPLEFRPERFLTVHKDKDVRGQNFELIPFGAGRRMCPGISLALMVTQLTLANLLHGFDVSTTDNGPVDMQEQVGLTNIKASPLDVLLTPRLSPHLYA